MSIVKKWAGCVMAFIAGVLGLAMSASSGMVIKTPLGSSTTKAYKVITESELMDTAKLLGVKSEFVLMKAFAIITLIIAVLLIAYSIVALLQNLNVIKSSHIAFDIAGWVLVGLFVISTIALLVSSNGYATAIEDSVIAAASGIKSVKVGLYQPFMLVVSIIAAIVTGIFAFLKRKDA